jgi:hypothetical protein
MSEMDKRSVKRRHLIYYLSVTDAAAGRPLGHLVDVTTEGIMLLSRDPIPVGRTFALRMALPSGVSEHVEDVEFEAKSLWCQKDANPDFYDTGFQLMSTSPRQLAVIGTLISDYGFAD